MDKLRFRKIKLLCQKWNWNRHKTNMTLKGGVHIKLKEGKKGKLT